MSSSVKLLAKYNTLANKRVIEAIPHRQFASCQFNDFLFFDTPHATINHIAGVTDLWLGRVFNEPKRAEKYNFLYLPQKITAATDDTSATCLTNSDGEQWLSLCPEWEKSVKWLMEISKEAEERVAALNKKESMVDDVTIVSFKSTSGDEMKASMEDGLVHLFNHNTHHRGQLHCALCAAGVRSCVLDLSYVMPIWK